MFLKAMCRHPISRSDRWQLLVAQIQIIIISLDNWLQSSRETKLVTWHHWTGLGQREVKYRLHLIWRQCAPTNIHLIWCSPYQLPVRENVGWLWQQWIMVLRPTSRLHLAPSLTPDWRNAFTCPGLSSQLSLSRCFEYCHYRLTQEFPRT